MNIKIDITTLDEIDRAVVLSILKDIQDSEYVLSSHVFLPVSHKIVDITVDGSVYHISEE